MKIELKYIYEVYKQQSFSKAAEKLYITQPALSLAVKRIEESLGVTLFDRSHNKIVLTDAGEIYLEYISKNDLLENELEQKLSDLSGLKSGTLKIGGTQYFNSYVLPKVVYTFQQKYPNVKIKILESSANIIKNKLNERLIDVMFSCDSIEPDKFSYKCIFKDFILLAVPKPYEINKTGKKFALPLDTIRSGNYLLNTYPCIPLALFSQTPFILLTKGNNLHDRSIQLFEEAEISPPINLELEQLVTAYNYARRGLGACFVTAFLAKNHLDSNLVYYKIESPLTARIFSAVFRRKSYISKATKLFLDIFMKVYSGTPNSF